MSQSLVRKSSTGETAAKARASLVKASGDSVPRGNQKQDHKSSRSKNKIPKSIRYDLENALVGLCDVWFEDIKPHLIRNKIKLHVDTNGATASGDFSRLPPAAPGCSHLDPGAASDRIRQTFANSAGCCSTQQTASRAQCRRPPARHLPPSLRHHPSSPPTLPDITSPNKTTKRKTPRKSSRKQPQQSDNWRVPRLCRTYSLVCPDAIERQPRRAHTASPVLNTRQESCLLSPAWNSRKTNMRSKYTQTKITISPYIKCQSPEKMPTAKSSNTNLIPKNQLPIHRTNAIVAPLKSELLRDSNLKNSPKLERNSSKMTFLMEDLRKKPGNEKPSMGTTSLRKSRAKKRQISDPRVVHSPEKQRQEKQPCKEVRHKNKSRVMQSNMGEFRRSYASTNLSSRTSNQELSQKNHRHQSQETPSELFDKDLIEIIGTKHDKRLRVLYKSPERQEYPSVMNLVASPSDQPRRQSRAKKTLPWR